MEIIINNINYWVIENNFFQTDLYSLEQAQSMAKTLTNCKGCYNCSNCYNCRSCDKCNFCQNCFSYNFCFNLNSLSHHNYRIGYH